MGTLEAGLLIVVAVTFVGGAVAFALAFLNVGLTRRALRRLAGHVAEVRRHPLVGSLPLEIEPAIRGLSIELNLLLADLRARFAENERRIAHLEGLAAGPPRPGVRWSRRRLGHHVLQPGRGDPPGLGA